jgi:hypothetical protein
MTRVGALVVVALVAASAGALAASTRALAASPGATKPVPSPLPLPMLPSVARVRLEVARDHLVAVEDIDLPRGGWRFGDLDLYVAFGAPGAPSAFDARLLAVADGALEPNDSDPGERMTFDHESHRPPTARDLLGASQMAGVVVHVPDASFRHAVARGGMAVLRLRSLLALPDEDARTGREVVVRLGAWQGTPLTVGNVQVAQIERSPRVTGAAAHLCGADADPWPLAIAIVPRPWPPPAPTVPAPIAPVLAVRHATDDLCVRFWTAD